MYCAKVIRFLHRFIVFAMLGLLPAAGSALADDFTAELSTRLNDILRRRSLGGEALRVVGNVIAHEDVRPMHAEAIVVDVLSQPASGADAAGFFARQVPTALTRLADAAARSQRPPTGSERVSIFEFLAPYLVDLEQARQLLAAAGKADGRAVLSGLGGDLPSLAGLRQVGSSVDPRQLELARDRFLAAHVALLEKLHAEGMPRFPEQAIRFASPVGVVSIGTYGDDEHPADAAVIVDPGGNDVYRRAPVIDGAVSVIIDFAGDDRYLGADPVIGGLSAIIDLAGNDRYESDGAGIAAAIGGVSLIVDRAGDDNYRAGSFGVAAAAFGLGAIIDVSGDDRYRVVSGGQGYGMAAGLGLLWDRAGNDRYVAAGPPDVWGRGGAISMAQGAAYGGRTFLGGGAGILRDDAGDDIYEAEMFAQGVGYYHGAGLLWDRGGDDRYRAVRYAQGAGVHEAYGLLRDESGNDRYQLAVGVGQGMGLDLAVGVLYDGDGDDDYRAGSLAQGAATANGIGIAIDLAGRNGWSLAAGSSGWGRADWARSLPTLGFLVFAPGYSSFERGGQIVVAGEEAARLGGPEGGAPRAFEPPSDAPCTPHDTASRPPAGLPAGQAAEALRALMPGLARGTADTERYAALRGRLVGDLRGLIAELPGDDFEVVYPLGIALRCTLATAPTEQAATLWAAMGDVLARDPATPFAGIFAAALRARPAPADQLGKLLDQFDAHPRCGVRSLSLLVRSENASKEQARADLAMVANRALASSCWREQAQALAALRRHKLPLPPQAPWPSFLD